MRAARRPYVRITDATHRFRCTAFVCCKILVRFGGPLKMLSKVWPGVLGLVLFGTAGLAQQLTLSGSVNDSEGVVPNVTVILKNSFGSTRQSITDALGQYKFEGLIAGSYELSFLRDGFDPVSRTVALATESR